MTGDGEPDFSGGIASVDRAGRLKIDFLPKLGMQILLNKYGTDGQLLKAFVDSSLDRMSMWRPKKMEHTRPAWAPQKQAVS